MTDTITNSICKDGVTLLYFSSRVDPIFYYICHTRMSSTMGSQSVQSEGLFEIIFHPRPYLDESSAYFTLWQELEKNLSD